MNAHRATLGLQPVRSFMDMMDRVDRHVILTSPAFDFPSASPLPNVRYAGPVLDDPVWAAPWHNPWPLAHPDPLVLVGLSTTFQNQGRLVQRLLAAVGGLPVRALVTVGPSLDPQQYTAQANTHVVASAPHSQVLPLVSAMVTHAGHGSVIRSLAHGVPLVCLPMGRDQNDVAARVVYRGAGLRLSASAKVAPIRAALERVLGEPGFRASAQKLGEAVRRDAAASTAVDELVGLASQTT
jgi:UDP:flavonoid glycosyltransferase YjiC (YdhE family)